MYFVVSKCIYMLIVGVQTNVTMNVTMWGCKVQAKHIYSYNVVPLKRYSNNFYLYTLFRKVSL